MLGNVRCTVSIVIKNSGRLIICLCFQQTQKIFGFILFLSAVYCFIFEALNSIHNIMNVKNQYKDDEDNYP